MGGRPATAFLPAPGAIPPGPPYLPPDQMAGALVRVADYYRESQAEIASRVLDARKKAASGVARSAGTLNAGLVDATLEPAKSAYDPGDGGVGVPPHTAPHPARP